MRMTPGYFSIDDNSVEVADMVRKGRADLLLDSPSASSIVALDVYPPTAAGVATASSPRRSGSSSFSRWDDVLFHSCETVLRQAKRVARGRSPPVVGTGRTFISVAKRLGDAAVIRDLAVWAASWTSSIATTSPITENGG